MSNNFIELWGNEKQRQNITMGGVEWFGKNSIFGFGNEIEYISFIKFQLKAMKNSYIFNDQFTYNFIPGYFRKLTHYKILDLISDIFPNAIVIILNGDGSVAWEYNEDDGVFSEKALVEEGDAAGQIENFIRDKPNRPVFVTGFICCGMSITFINENLGNFDNVILKHDHISRPDVIYQLCRWCFNCIKWGNKDKIKTTNIFSNSDHAFKIAKEYEQQIDKINETMDGSIRTLDEVKGNIPIKPRSIPKEKKYAKLEVYSKRWAVRTFPVEDNNDENVLNQVKKVFKEFTGKDLKGKSMPRKNEGGFYTCSRDGPNKVQDNPSELKAWAKTCTFNSNLALVKGKYKYARVYVAYDDETNSKEYTWILRRMEIKNTPKVNEIWDEIKSQ